MTESWKIGESIEINTKCLDTEPDMWEAATVYATGGLLGTRNIEVEYVTGGVTPVAVSRVRRVL
jgi:hypothetical protein